MNIMQKKEILTALENFWLSQPEIDLQNPISNEEIVNAQAFHHLQLPPPLIDCLKIANGFLEKDKYGFRFWSLLEIRTIQDDEFNKYDKFLQFSDYLDESWTYAVSCIYPHPVIFVGTNAFQEIVTTNFYDFLILYLQDHPNLYPFQ